MLEVGNGGMTTEEDRAHFSLWCLIKSPLLIGADLTKIDNTSFAILTNKEVIALSQDSLGVQGHMVNQTGDAQVWSVQHAHSIITYPHTYTHSPLDPFHHNTVIASWTYVMC